MDQLYLTLAFQAAGLVYLIVGLLTIVGDNKNTNRLIFFFICMDYAAWALYTSLMNMALKPSDVLVFLDIRRFFGALIYPLILIFMMRASGMDKEVKKSSDIHAMIFIPALLTLVVNMTNPTSIRHIEKTRLGWVYNIISLTDTLNAVIIMLYAVTTVLLILYLYIKEETYKRKKQTYLIILIATLVSSSLTNYADTILRMGITLPLDRFSHLPPIGAIATVLQILVIYYFIQKNNFLNIDVSDLILDIIEKVEDGILIENSEEEIIYANNAVKILCGCGEAEILERKISGLDKLKDLEQAKASNKVERISRQKENKHLLVSFLRMEDRFGQYFGGVYNIKDATELINTIIELEEAERNLKGQVDQRTKELQEEIEIRKLNEEKLRFLAYNDSMTKLLNRRSLFEAAETNLEENPDKRHAFIFMDINFFKTINDQYGHSEGDRMLITTANRLKEVYKDDAYVARFGGDEFVVFIKNTNPEEIRQYIEKMYQRFEESYKIGSMAYKISLSHGVAIYPDDGENLDKLIKIADERMYEDKKTKKAQGETIIKNIREETRE